MLNDPKIWGTHLKRCEVVMLEVHEDASQVIYVVGTLQELVI